MNKKALSIITTLALIVTINANVFAAPATSTSTTLKEVQDNKKELQVKVESLDKQINEIMTKIDSNKKDMNNVAQEIKNTQAKLQTAENNSKAQVEIFKKRVRAMYMNGVDGYVEVVFKAENFNDLISRMDTISQVIGFDKKVIEKLKTEKDAIAKQKEGLDDKNSKLEALKVSNQNTLATLSKDIKEQKAILDKTTEKEKELTAKEYASAASKSTSSSGNFTPSRGGSMSYSKVMNMEATAYSGDGITASGAPTKRNPGGYSTIAVDPRVIPLGTRVYVDGYGYAIAEDTGGAIKGNIIDVFVTSESEAHSWGRRQVTVYILN